MPHPRLSNAALINRVVGDMTFMISAELTASYFQNLVPTLTSATNAVASATPATLLDGPEQSKHFAVFPWEPVESGQYHQHQYLFASKQHTGQSTGGATGPNQPAQWTILLTNNSPNLQVYTLSVTGCQAE